MKQSKAVVLATIGILALSACGTQNNNPGDGSGDPVLVDPNNNGGGEGGNNNGGGGSGSSRVPTGPTGPLTKNVDCHLSKSDAKLVRGIIEGVSQARKSINSRAASANAERSLSSGPCAMRALWPDDSALAASCGAVRRRRRRARP